MSFENLLQFVVRLCPSFERRNIMLGSVVYHRLCGRPAFTRPALTRTENTVRNNLELDEVVALELADIDGGKVDYFHTGIDCSSWSVLSSLSRGTRTVEKPCGKRKRSSGSSTITANPSPYLGPAARWSPLVPGAAAW